MKTTNIRIEEKFWTKKGFSWILLLLIITFLGELPFVLGTDIFNLNRQIYGVSSLRYNLAIILNSDNITFNSLGWLLDFDKIFPWIVTIVCFLLFRKVLIHSKDEKFPVDIAKSFPSWVFFSGLIGAIFIVFHYCYSSSGHYTSFLDKGLFDAFAHLFKKGENHSAWLCLSMYRLIYLVLSPFMYFVLFATVSASFYYLLRLIKLLNATKKDKKSYNLLLNKILQCLLICGLPTFLLFLLHQICSYSFGLRNYQPEGVRFYMLLFLYLEFIIFIVITWIHYRKVEPNKQDTDIINVKVTESIKNVKQNSLNLFYSFGIITQLIIPVTGKLINFRATNINLALDHSSIAYIVDYNYLPNAAYTYNSLVKDVMQTTYNSYDLYKLFENYEDDNVKALILSTISLIKIGVDSSEFMQIHVNQKLVAKSFLERYYYKTPNLYPIFNSNEKAKKYFKKRVFDLIDTWVKSSKNVNFKLEYKEQGMALFVKALFDSKDLRKYTSFNKSIIPY
jgi:hypothetical protein